MSDITLTPIAYRVEQAHNEYFYYIKWYNRTGTFKWFAFSGTESHPDFFSIYPDFVKGFDTIYEARAQINHYLETVFPIKGPKKMTDIMSAIASDIEEYEWLCERYDEEIQLKQSLYGKWVPDCYCEHAITLKRMHMDDIEAKRLAAAASEKV